MPLMSQLIDTPTELARELVNLAERCAVALPREARELLFHAARVWRETGEPTATLDCERAAGQIKDLTKPPRSRPFVPAAIAPQALLERHRDGDWDLNPSEADAAELKRLGASSILPASFLRGRRR